MRIHGHAPGHVRETALAAFDAWLNWNSGEPEPTVEFEVSYEPCEIPISKALGMVWNCIDIVPGGSFDWIQDNVSRWEPAIKRRTYAAVARFILGQMKIEREAA
jgi:hypothetical protein